MNRLARTLICAVGASGALGLGATAAPALAESYSIDLSGPATAVVGQPVVVQASGQNPPPSDWWATSWIKAGAIPASVMPSCPADQSSGIGVAVGAGGDLLEIAMPPNLDPTGAFNNAIGWTPRYAGDWLICGYQDDGTGYTLARDQLNIHVSAPSGSSGGGGGSATGTPGPGTAAKPANVKRPKVTRSHGKLACSPGKWSNSSGGYSYGWLVNGKAKKGAGARKLLVTRKLHGHKVQCSVTATGPGGKTTAVSSPLRVR
jgi:hypothetical protein